MFVISFHN